MPQVPIARSPLVIASVGTHTGPLGAVFWPIVQGAQVWVQSVNQAGGLNGHPIRLITYDDGGDTVRHRTQVQEAIERRGAVAFLANTEGVTGQPSVQYIESKRVSVIGTELGEPWVYESPMYFPQGGADSPRSYGILGAVADSARGAKTKVASVTCVEAQGCRNAKLTFAKYGREFGLTVVYHGQVSIAQPDVTAECLNARQAGAEISLVGLDSNSLARVASSCARQGFRPLFGTLGAIVTDVMKDDPNLDGLGASTSVGPELSNGNAGD